MAPRISGFATTCGKPSAANVTNHTIMIGPKNRPTRAVPNRCTANRPASTSTANGRTRLSKLSFTTDRPSMADITEIAGVITLSP